MKKTMGDIKSHNFWYAVNNTEVVLMPKSYLETFGTTNLRYHMVSELMDTAGPGQPCPPEMSLTPREIEVLGLMAEGMTNQQIAEQLIVSPTTVKTHVQNILQKLGVSDRTQAAVYAVRCGLIS